MGVRIKKSLNNLESRRKCSNFVGGKIKREFDEK